MNPEQSIANNLEHIYSVIDKTARNAGRNRKDITLVAVSKRFPASAIETAMQAGQMLFGENYIQEATEKRKLLGPEPLLHFIGHLQTNKAKDAAQLFNMIETVDRLKLAVALNKRAAQLKKTLDVLIQVNIGREPQKSGINPEQIEELLEKTTVLDNINVRGMMIIPPFSKDPESSRIHFQSLRLLSEKMQKKNLLGLNNLPVDLSMGMSNDYQVAIEEGATLIRVGTAIFGKRL